MKLIKYYRDKRWGAWIRIFGVGILWKRRKYKLFSERNGYTKGLTIGDWFIKFLKPQKA